MAGRAFKIVVGSLQHPRPNAVCSVPVACSQVFHGSFSCEPPPVLKEFKD
jgi:hypothetical protein